MKRVLVVANQTLGGNHLLDEVRSRAGSSTFHVLVPATPAHEQWVYTEGEAAAIASERLDRALARFRALGVEVTGEVGAERPLDAVRDALRAAEYDEIVVSTLPPGASRWLGMDLPRRIERAFPVPVTHVVGEPERVTPG
jgi:hypothetical protein